VVDALCEAFARDQLEVHELERRLDEANRARTDAELRQVLAGLDLAALTAPDTALVAASRPVAENLLPAQGIASRIARVDPELVPERQFTLSFWSGRSRKGSWIPAKNISAIAIQGGIQLDFREARFGPGVTHVRAVAVMGGVEIMVPPGLHVETSGFAIMGAFEDEADASRIPPQQGPILRVTGLACMGAVEVKVRLPGETDRDARARKKRLRRQRKARLEAGEYGEYGP
jgi:hypothetical protein